MILKILIADDSSFARKVIREMLSTSRELAVIGEAENGRQALEMARELKPDAIVLDLFMPDQDGLWSVENILRETPTPIVLFSGVTAANAEITDELFRYGILDVVRKPTNPLSLRMCQEELVAKVIAAAKSKSTFQSLYRHSNIYSRPNNFSTTRPARSLVAVIASAGAPVVLAELLKNISEKFEQLEGVDTAVVAALHMPEELLRSFLSSLAQTLPCPLVIAKDGDIIRRKNIYFSPGRTTLCLKRVKKVGAVANLNNLNITMQPHFDTFLKSVAGVFAKKTVAIVLSGMGNHGLEGVAAVKRAGGSVIAQNPFTAGVSAMPQAVIEEHLADKVLPVALMAPAIFEILRPAFPDANHLPTNHYSYG